MMFDKEQSEKMLVLHSKQLADEEKRRIVRWMRGKSV